MRQIGSIARGLAHGAKGALGQPVHSLLLPAGASLLVPACALTALALPPSAVQRLTSPFLGDTGISAQLEDLPTIPPRAGRHPLFGVGGLVGEAPVAGVLGRALGDRRRVPVRDQAGNLTGALAASSAAATSIAPPASRAHGAVGDADDSPIGATHDEPAPSPQDEPAPGPTEPGDMQGGENTSSSPATPGADETPESGAPESGAPESSAPDSGAQVGDGVFDSTPPTGPGGTDAGGDTAAGDAATDPPSGTTDDSADDSTTPDASGETGATDSDPTCGPPGQTGANPGQGGGGAPGQTGANPGQCGNGNGNGHRNGRP